MEETEDYIYNPMPRTGTYTSIASALGQGQVVPPLRLPMLEVNFEDYKKWVPHIKNVEIKNHVNEMLQTSHDVDGVVTINEMISGYNQGQSFLLTPIQKKLSKIINALKPAKIPKELEKEDEILAEAILSDLRNLCQRILNLSKTDPTEQARQLKEEENKTLEPLLVAEQKKIKGSITAVLESFVSNLSNWPFPKHIYIAYAWPLPEYEKREKWVQTPFLTILREHLRAAGFSYTLLDIKDNQPGDSIARYMKAAQSSDYILLIGTESLLAKHRAGTYLVCTELIYASRKRRVDEKRGEKNVIPILLTGTLETSFPAGCEIYTTARDWRKKGYEKNLQQLLFKLYGLSERYDFDKEFMPRWNKSCNQLTAEQAQLLSQTKMNSHVHKSEAQDNNNSIIGHNDVDNRYRMTTEPQQTYQGNNLQFENVVVSYSCENRDYVQSICLRGWLDLQDSAINARDYIYIDDEGHNWIDGRGKDFSSATHSVIVDLSKSIFVNVDFTEAKFNGAILEKTQFNGSKLQQAEFSGVKNLSAVNLSKAVSIEHIKVDEQDETNRAICKAAIFIQFLEEENSQLKKEVQEMKEQLSRREVATQNNSAFLVPRMM